MDGMVSYGMVTYGMVTYGVTYAIPVIVPASYLTTAQHSGITILKW